jgi:hypothetical protein
MSISHFFWKKSIKYLCDSFNQGTINQYLEMYNALRPDFSLTDASIVSSSVSNQEKAVFAAMIIIGLKIKNDRRDEYKHYTAYDFNRITNGRFEILAFMALHQGSKIVLNSYRNNYNSLVKDCQFVYEQITLQAPNAITLSLNSFIERAHASLAHS